jgi:hypothetical protein
MLNTKNQFNNIHHIGYEFHNLNEILPESISFADVSRNNQNYISSLPQSINNTMNFNNVNSFSDKHR